MSHLCKFAELDWKSEVGFDLCNQLTSTANFPSPNSFSSSFVSNVGSSTYFAGTARSIVSCDSQVSSVSLSVIEFARRIFMVLWGIS